MLVRAQRGVFDTAITYDEMMIAIQCVSEKLVSEMPRVRAGLRAFRPALGGFFLDHREVRMSHYPKPFFRPGRRLWYVQIQGKQINLGPDEAEALRRYHELMATPK